MHRDLNPNTILVTSDGNNGTPLDVVVADYSTVTLAAPRTVCKG